MEFKERLADGKPGNLKLAQEIASLAIDGGAIVVGVVDPKNRSGSSPVDALSPVKLDGLVERIESVARSVPDPPIPVSCRVIPSDREASTGYVVVEIPQSAEAPHFVDGRPYGRNGTQKAILSRSEVVSIIEARRIRARQAELDLDRCRKRWPREAAVDHPNGFLYLSAVPLGTRDDQGYASHSGERPEFWSRQILEEACTNLPPGNIANLFTGPKFSRSVDGVLLSDWPVHNSELLDRADWSDHDALEFCDDGIVRFVSGWASIWQSRQGSLSPSGDAEMDHHLCVYEMVVSTCLALRCIGLYGRRMDYSGTWSLSLSIEGIAGAGISWYRPPTDGRRHNRYPEDHYLRSTPASTLELCSKSGRVGDRMFDPLLRVLQVQDHEGVRKYLDQSGD